MNVLRLTNTMGGVKPNVARMEGKIAQASTLFSNSSIEYSVAATHKPFAPLSTTHRLLAEQPIRSSGNTKLNNFSSYRHTRLFTSNGFVQSNIKLTNNISGPAIHSFSIPQTRLLSTSLALPAQVTDGPEYTPKHAINTHESVKHYLKDRNANKRDFTYFMLSSSRFMLASVVRLAILEVIYYMSASKAAMAMASIEVDVSKIPKGKTVTVKWRGKPVFIRHRLDDEVTKEIAVPQSELKHYETDEQRYKTKPEWIVVVGVCTHLGCVPVGDAGLITGGFFCPCHGSHYDTAGRIRKGPAPLNLEVPQHGFADESERVMVIG